MMDGFAGGGDIDVAIVLAGHDGRVDQHVKRYRLEADLVGRLLVDGKRGTELPSLGNDERGLIGLFVGRSVGRVKHDLIPFEHHQLVSGRAAVGFDEIVVGLEMGCAGGHVDVECKDVEQVALPGDGFSVGLELQAGEAGDGAFRPMLAGDPLGVIKGERAGLDRQHKMGVEQLLLGPGGIDGEQCRLVGAQRRRCNQ